MLSPMMKRLVPEYHRFRARFGAVAVLGVIVIPIIIRTWGVTEFGLIVLARLLLPTGLMASSTSACRGHHPGGRARARASRLGPCRQPAYVADRLRCLLALTLSARHGCRSLSYPRIKVEPAHVAKFTTILRYTAIANLLLFPALVWEGIVKGFSSGTVCCEFRSSCRRPAYVA